MYTDSSTPNIARSVSAEAGEGVVSGASMVTRPP